MERGIAGIILAGGLSRRMGGGEKALMPLGGVTLLDHVVGRIRPQVEEIALNANGDPSRFHRFGLPVVADTVPGFAGPLAGLLAGLEWAAANGYARLVSVAADTPFFPADLASRLCAASGGADRIALARSGGARHPTFALLPVSLLERLRNSLVRDGNRRVAAFIDGCPHVDVDFSLTRLAEGGSVDPFFNINTPQDLAEAERLYRSLT
jgi:molybdopterin-guanine dinucleotide biosynthesis protein A